jgi:hypothetical protein
MAALPQRELASDRREAEMAGVERLLELIPWPLIFPDSGFLHQ